MERYRVSLVTLIPSPNSFTGHMLPAYKPATGKAPKRPRSTQRYWLLMELRVRKLV